MEVADEAAHCKDVAEQHHSLIVAILIVTISKVIRGANGSSSAGPQVLESNLGHGSHSLPARVSCKLPAINFQYCIMRHAGSAILQNVSRTDARSDHPHCLRGRDGQ